MDVNGIVQEFLSYGIGSKRLSEGIRIPMIHQQSRRGPADAAGKENYLHPLVLDAKEAIRTEDFEHGLKRERFKVRVFQQLIRRPVSLFLKFCFSFHVEKQADLACPEVVSLVFVSNHVDYPDSFIAEAAMPRMGPVPGVFFSLSIFAILSVGISPPGPVRRNRLAVAGQCLKTAETFPETAPQGLRIMEKIRAPMDDCERMKKWNPARGRPLANTEGKQH